MFIVIVGIGMIAVLSIAAFVWYHSDPVVVLIRSKRELLSL